MCILKAAGQSMQLVVRVFKVCNYCCVQIFSDLCQFLYFLAFPCVYTTVKCGLSGHNIRVVPDLDSPAIGMVILGNQLTAINEVSVCIVNSFFNVLDVALL